jgi:PilZ domain
MSMEPGIDFPDERTAVDVQTGSRDDVLVSFVEKAAGEELVLSVGQDSSHRRVRLDPGEFLDLLWRGPEELRAVPAVLVAVDAGITPTWRVRMTGPATRGQRRAAVRAPLGFPVEMSAGESLFQGRTLDLSEGGVRCLLRPVSDSAAAAEPTASPDGGTVQQPSPSVEIGTVATVTMHLDGDRIACQAEVVRRHRRDDQGIELSLRLIDLGERREDVIRRHVFAGLRELRSRGLL